MLEIVEAISTFTGVSSLWLSLYVLQAIAGDVNGQLPENQRVLWKWWQAPPPLKIHWVWREHVRLYPHSQKRNYFALFLLLMVASVFAVPICLVVCRR